MNVAGDNGLVLGLTADRLRPVELGKHKALLAGIMRLADRRAIPDHERVLGIPYRLLSDVAALAPPVVMSVLASPQFGAWANDAFRCLLADAPDMKGAPREMGLGRLALFAATAAMQGELPFDVEVPLRDGTASFPTLGTAYLGPAPPLEWGRAWLDGAGPHVRSRSAVADISATRHTATENWSPLPRVAISERGLRLDVVLDHDDPFLDRYGPARSRIDGADVSRWRSLLAEGWQILASGHRPLASLVADAVRTVVPLAAPDPQHMASGTEETAFGAIASSLPPDALGMAQVLVHESHHVVLGAVRDIEPLVQDDGEGDQGQPFLGYAPWRDDPRPGHALLQGIYAHYGMGQFWQQEYLAGALAHRERAAVEFSRMRTMTARGARTLTGSGLLTDAGREFLAGIEDEIAAWLRISLPAGVERHVADLTHEHEARWRARWLAGS
jgi:HEXXH motif-containing protein